MRHSSFGGYASFILLLEELKNTCLAYWMELFNQGIYFRRTACFEMYRYLFLSRLPAFLG